MLFRLTTDSWRLIVLFLLYDSLETAIAGSILFGILAGLLFDARRVQLLEMAKKKDEEIEDIEDHRHVDHTEDVFSDPEEVASD